MALITIGIPTWNRSKELAITLDSLQSLPTDVKSRVEVVISDNCSSDETQTVVTEFLSRNHGFDSVVATQTLEHTNFVRNFINCLRSANSPYFMFLGDDDLLQAEALRGLLDMLNDGRWGLVVQYINPPKNLGGVSPLSVEDTFELFYDFANAWAGIYNVQACKQNLDTDELQLVFDKFPVFGHAILGFLSYVQSGKPALGYFKTLGKGRDVPIRFKLAETGVEIWEASEALANFSPVSQAMKRSMSRGIRQILSSKAVGLIATWPSRPADRDTLNRFAAALLSVKGFRCTAMGLTLKVFSRLSWLRTLVTWLNSLRGLKLDSFV